MSKPTGAPSQYSQPSRKGKRAWRKNVDIVEVEEALEGVREEERLTGTPAHKKTDRELFQIDTKGDEQLKRVLPKYDRSQLMSSKILAQRSMIPAVLSRPSQKRQSPLTHEEKGRLLRMGKRKVKGPFNAVVDPTEFGAGSAILEPTEAVKKSGTYNIWEDTSKDEIINEHVKDKGKFKDPEEFLLPLVSRPSIKVPDTKQPHRSIDLPAVAKPHQGTSYNPSDTAHKELLLGAHEIEVRREGDAAKFEGIKERMTSASCSIAEDAEKGAPGMIVDSGEPAPDVADDVEEPQDNVAPTRTAPSRKTQKQRRKAAQLLAERRALIDRRHRRRLLAAVSTAKLLRAQVANSIRARHAVLEARRTDRAELIKQRGMIGQKIGKHRVMAGEIDVQLGEELSETLRELKPQGNLFRDRFYSLQHRALLEPRVRVFPKRRKTKIKEYEKHAWKRFE